LRAKGRKARVGIGNDPLGREARPLHYSAFGAEGSPYKFCGKEKDEETGYYAYPYRNLDDEIGHWNSTDPAIPQYLPSANDFNTEHDYYWYLSQDSSKKLPGIGGVFNSINLNVYCYAGNNPVKFVDPDGNMLFHWHYIITYYEAQRAGLSKSDSIIMALSAVWWDFKPGSQKADDPKTVNSHGMRAGESRDKSGNLIQKTQSPKQAEKGTLLFIIEKIKEGSIASVGEATHAGVDLPTEGHKGKVWGGELTIDHLKKDTYPSDKALIEAGTNVRIIIQEAIKANPNLINKDKK
jgi:RHS repeat-associated protein